MASLSHKSEINQKTMCRVQKNMEIGGENGPRIYGSFKNTVRTIDGVVVWYVILEEFGADMVLSSGVVGDGYGNGNVALKFILFSFIFNRAI